MRRVDAQRLGRTDHGAEVRGVLHVVERQAAPAGGNEIRAFGGFGHTADTDDALRAGRTGNRVRRAGRDLETFAGRLRHRPGLSGVFLGGLRRQEGRYNLHAAGGRLAAQAGSFDDEKSLVRARRGVFAQLDGQFDFIVCTACDALRRVIPPFSPLSFNSGFKRQILSIF